MSGHFVDDNHALITGHITMAIAMATPIWAAEEGEYRAELIDDDEGNHTNRARLLVKGHRYIVRIDVETDDDADDEFADALEETVRRGWLKRGGVDGDGRQLYGITPAGEAAVEAGFEGAGDEAHVAPP